MQVEHEERKDGPKDKENGKGKEKGKNNRKNERENEKRNRNGGGSESDDSNNGRNLNVDNGNKNKKPKKKIVNKAKFEKDLKLLKETISRLFELCGEKTKKELRENLEGMELRDFKDLLEDQKTLLVRVEKQSPEIAAIPAGDWIDTACDWQSFDRDTVRALELLRENAGGNRDHNGKKGNRKRERRGDGGRNRKRRRLNDQDDFMDSESDEDDDLRVAQ